MAIMAAPAAVNPSGRPAGMNTCDQPGNTSGKHPERAHAKSCVHTGQTRLEHGRQPTTAGVSLASKASGSP